MKTALLKYPKTTLTQPTDVTGAMICSLSGLRAPENPDPVACPTRYEYFLNGTQPGFQTDNLRRDIPIFKPSQTPATPDQITTTPGDVENQNHAVVFDALGTMLCLDCAGGYGPATTVTLDSTGMASTK